MTTAENIAIPARDDAPFEFHKGATRFFPGAGARLRFASNGTDTLTLPGLPLGMLSAGDAVTVTYLGTTVFAGKVATLVERQGRGTDRVVDVTAEGPWGDMARMVFRQQWKVAGEGGAVSTSFSRLVLNQSPTGEPQDMTAQIEEIAGYAASACGFEVGDIDAGDQVLPADEARDITCAAAIMRTLRFFPQTVCRFDYSTATPTFNVSIPPDIPETAEWLASISATQRSYTRTAHPVVGVDIATESYDIETGDDSVDRALRTLSHQTAGVTDSLDTLHVFIPLERGSGSTSWESMDVTVEEHTFSSIVFWMQCHPALAGVTRDQIKSFGPFTRSGSRNYTKMTETPVGDLRRFGLGAEFEHMTMAATIETADKKEDVVLSLDVITTDASTRTYTRQTGSSSTAGETLPDGLAAAILSQRGGSLMAEEMTIRLGDSLPTLGDADVVTENGVTQVLYLQDIDVDCYDLTAQLHFGRPAYLSPEDMRDLLLGFRQRAYATNVPDRGDEDESEDAQVFDGVQPIASACQVIDTVAKTTIKGGEGAGSIVLDGSTVDDGKTIETAKLKYTDAEGNEKEAQILGTEDVEIGSAVVAADPDASVEVDGKKIYASVRKDGGKSLVGLSENAPDPGTDAEGYCNNISHDGQDGADPGNDISGDSNLEHGPLGGGVPDNSISRWPCRKPSDNGGNS